MTLSILNTTGDGISDIAIRTNVELPDSGTSVNIGGYVQVPKLAQVAITGSPLTMPAAPGSGSIFWNIQIDAVTGAATVQQSTVADPAPILSSDGATPQVVIFRQTLVPTSGTDPALDPSSTPDTY